MEVSFPEHNIAIMIKINNYIQVSYSDLQKLFDSYYDNSGLKDIETALKLEVKSTATVRNIFRKDNQVVSDEVMTKFIGIIGLDGFILWVNGKRHYYVKSTL